MGASVAQYSGVVVGPSVSQLASVGGIGLDGGGGAVVPASRPNLFSFTDNFANAYWFKAGSTIASDATLDPSGTTLADKLQEDASNGLHAFVNASGIALGNAAYTVSFYAKAAERSAITLPWEVSPGSTSHLEAAFSLAGAGSIISADSGMAASIAPALGGGGGWYRCQVTRTVAANTWGFGVYLYSGGIAYQGVAGQGLYIWGAKLELGTPASIYP